MRRLAFFFDTLPVVEKITLGKFALGGGCLIFCDMPPVSLLMVQSLFILIVQCYSTAVVPGTSMLCDDSENDRARCSLFSFLFFLCFFDVG